MFNIQATILGLSFAFTFTQVRQVKAQLIPDNTLGKENSLVNSINSLEDRIDGGAVRGSNLFHSFKEFNIGNSKNVNFNNPTTIQNILTRVTGNNQSQILGKLGVLGNANLFLINPHGIIFGKDASLDIKGSFVGSTASFINFVDGTQFSAVSAENKPLLTVSAPLGLGMGNNPGEIRVKGDGHSIFGDGISIPFIDSSTKGLEVAPGKTIALIGGNIILEGGLIKTKFGRIELGSFGGNVAINAKGVFGTQFREFTTPESDITATSGKGAEFNGVVDINTITINPDFGLAELPTGLTDSSNKIAAGCSANRASNFTAIGRGGLPENPNQLFVGNNPIVNLIDFVSTSENHSISISSNSSTNNHKKSKNEIIEAQGWIVDSAGNIEFVAEVPNVKPNSGKMSQANCQSLS